MVISLERLGGLELVGKLTKVMGWRGGLKVMEVERRIVMAWSKSAGGG